MMEDVISYQAAGNKGSKGINTVFIIEGVFIIFILLDLIYLNIAFVQKSKSSQSELTTASIVNVPDQSQPQIFDKTTSPAPVLTTKPSPTLSPSPTTKPAATSTTQSSSIKDYFIPLGSGTSQAGDWTNVTGAQATVDFGQYQNIKSIVLEASVSVPTGNQAVYVRLFNDTDKHPVWYSDVTMSGSTSAYLVSSPIIYDTGSKTYQVQMKTQLQYESSLTQARIHIILN